MKTVITIASATLFTLCIVYFVRLNESAGQLDNAASSTGLQASTGVIDNSENVVTLIDKQELSDASKGLRVTKTTLRIDPEKQSMVYGKKGTGLMFPANAFVDDNGNVVKGKVNISLEECYDISEMLAAKLSTTSNGKMLETAGMVNIRATSDGREVHLQDGAFYNIYFPKGGRKNDDFKLFYGVWNDEEIIDWKLADNQSPEKVSPNRTDERIDNSPPPQVTVVPRDDCFIQICESYLRRGTQVSEMDYFNWKLANGQTLNQWFVANFNPDLKMLDDFCLDGMRSRISFKVDREGNFLSYYIANSSTMTEYDRYIAGFLQTMPALDLGQLMPTYTDDHACMLTFGTRESEQQNDFVNDFRRRFKATDNKPMNNVETSDLDYFVFSSSELGWINCDRFVEEEGSLVDFVVSGNASPGASVSMVFEDINSVLKGVNEGGSVVFQDVPSGRRVRIVGLDNPNKNPEMCVVKANTADKKAFLSVFKPVTLPELEGEFARR